MAKGSLNYIEKIILFLLILIVLVYLLESLSGILMPFVLGFLGAYLFDKPTKFLEKIVFSRSLASALIILAFLSLLFILVFVALPYLQKELLILASSLPKIVMKWAKLLSPYFKEFENHFSFEQISNHIGDILKVSLQVVLNLLSHGGRVATLVSLTIITPLIMFYWLRDWPSFTSFVIKNSHVRCVKIFNEIHQTLGQYLKGQSLVCLVLTVAYPFGLYLIGFKKFILIGLISGILSFVPYLGLITGILLSFSLNFSDEQTAVSFLALSFIFLIISLIEGNILAPKFIGTRIRVHPIGILFALLAGGTLFGFIGVILALPGAAIVRILMEHGLHSLLDPCIRKKM